MIPLADVRASNAALKSLPAGLVAVFVGGTSGIGLFTARKLVQNTVSPHIYLVGRNQEEASKIITELKQINSSSQIDFIQKDVSLLKNVDEACKEISTKEKHINLLFMTCGTFTLKGRQETSEGLDRKFALHYYTRMRFIDQLQPLLTAAASSSSPLSRVVAVLDPQPGLKNVPNFSDLSLKSNFSLTKCATHASAMTNLSFSSLAAKHPGTAYVHAFPYVVETGVGRDAWGPLASIVGPLLKVALKPVTVKQEESGERHLYAATSPKFSARGASSTAAETAAMGSDGVKGSGSYCMNWNNDILDDTANAKAVREEGGEKKVGEHLDEVFKKICVEGGKY